MNQPTRQYYVDIPPGVPEGQSFDVVVEGKRISVVRPQGTATGSKLQISAISVGSPRYTEAATFYRIPDYVIDPERTAQILADEQRIRKDRLDSILAIWLGFELIILILLILAASLNRFATQYLSTSCNAVNPKTGNIMTRAYYNLWKGFGSSPECKTSGKDFCIPWTNNSAWSRFMSISAAGNNIYFSTTSYSWATAQVLIVLAACFVFITMLVHWSAYKVPNLAICGGYTMLLTWIFALSGINEATAGSPSLSSTIWAHFYQNGGSIASLTTPGTGTVASPPTGCSIAITYEDGGALLSSAVGVSFGLLIAIMISGCCGWLSVPDTEGSSSSYGTTGGTAAAAANNPVQMPAQMHSAQTGTTYDYYGSASAQVPVAYPVESREQRSGVVV